ncbi:MAG TPA: hypothetical protein VGT98_10550, partial [Candidatus Elarobacter sp.]|nr:hypothetical protein [Candidatus Elarobacter sp.]
EAYWVSLKDYFADPARRRSRRIVFDKVRDRFDSGARSALFAIAKSRDAGLYTPPMPREETLFSNILPVTRLPTRLYLAETQLSETRSVFAALRDAGIAHPPSEWILKEKRILSAVDLDAPEWRRIVDRGALEEFSTSEWAATEDPDRRRDFVTLLNRCLTARLGRFHVRWDKALRHFYFRATADLSPRTITYTSVKQKAARVVFAPYAYKDETKRALGRPAYYRHHALDARFLRFDGDWVLTLTPTYHFTSDGSVVHPYYESKLKGIKALENNQAVLGQVAMWASLLADPDGDLFARAPYPHLGFGSLANACMHVGLDEASWLTPEVTLRSSDFDDGDAGSTHAADEPGAVDEGLFAVEALPSLESLGVRAAERSR